MSKNTQNSILHIHLAGELQRYNLERKWNDYIAVQKEVLKVLREDIFLRIILSYIRKAECLLR